MPTRTINLKLITGRSDDKTKLRQAIWLTHLEINCAVAGIERLLLLCRGAAYWTLENEKENQISQGEVLEQALLMAREIQRRNGRPNAGTDEQILITLRNLYEKLVPSCIEGQDGDAQAANAWVSPLMSKDSKGGLSVYEKILDPHWVTMKKDNRPEWERESEQWLQSSEAQRLIKSPGSPPGWVRQYRAGKPWQDSFIKDQEKKKKEIESGNAPVISQLRELGLLPLIEPPIRRLIDPNGKGVTVWDRLAMRLAVAHLLSWESWNQTTQKEHAKAVERRDSLRDEYQSITAVIQQIQEYETARHQELKRVALASDDNPFRIGPRMLRAWGKVKEEWIRKGKSVEDRRQILKDLQTKLRGKFGDPNFFTWLAAEGRESLWKDPDSDPVTALMRMNVADRLVRKRKAYSMMTFANARIHPRWVMFEAPGGSNLRNYHLEQTDDGPYVKLCLLSYDSSGSLAEENFRIKLAPSGQLQDFCLEESTDNGKKRCCSYTSAHQKFRGVPGGAELLLSRDYLENKTRSDTDITAGKVGPVWLKLTLDVQSKAPEGWIDNRGRIAVPPEVLHYRLSLSKKSEYEAGLKPGLRILSVDLGLRTFASCSVFELVEGQPERGMAIPTADGRRLDDPEKIWAKHERSFRLTLPGEDVSRIQVIQRRIALDDVRSLRRDVNRLKQILRLSAVEEDQRRDELVQQLKESVEQEETTTVLDVKIFDPLEDRRFRDTQELWQQRCKEVYQAAEGRVAGRFSQWRKSTRPRAENWDEWRKRRGYAGGKSLWMLQYLDAVRKLIIGWSMRGREYAQINRQNKERFGTIASHLLAHINNLKEDRIKSGTDMIIQAARGYVPNPDGIGWVKKFEPCRVILFEDIARYRFKVDRPRRENSQLMKWNHREIVGDVKSSEAFLQAEIYGISVETTAAGYSSRYLASTGAPGIRCRRLTSEDFEDGMIKQYVVLELDWMAEKEIAGLKQGMLVPWHGGDLFATLKPDGKGLHLIHADLNAAQNLQRRFLSRCGEAYRLVCKKAQEDGKEVYLLDKPPGLRLLGALQLLSEGKHFRLKADEKYPDRFLLEGRRTKSKAGDLVDEGSMEEIEEEFEDAVATSGLDAEASGGRETFFRDPSGIFFHSNHWVRSGEYWSIVRNRVWKSMRAGADV